MPAPKGLKPYNARRRANILATVEAEPNITEKELAWRFKCGTHVIRAALDPDYAAKSAARSRALAAERHAKAAAL